MIAKTVLALLLAGLAVSHAETGIERLYRLDLLPRFHESLSVGAISSHDRTGGNDDGFSGKYSYVRKEGDALVIADLKGPGVIYRVWTPTPTDDITEFYFDGEDTPRIRLPFRKLFTGEEEPFLTPLAGLGAGGFYSYVPLPYEKSCKIVVRAEKVRFYQINYATYPEATGIQTYPGAGDSEYQNQLQKARDLVARTGSDIVGHMLPPGAKLRRQNKTVTLQAGEPATIFATRTPGRIVGIRLGPSAALAGKTRSIVLRAWWDDDPTPAIECPAGDLFGYAWGEPAVKSLLLGTVGDRNYIYLPMPFDRSARIELLQEDEEAATVEIQAEIAFADTPRNAGEGRLYATWRRENPTEQGKPFTILDTNGRGHLVGVILQAQGFESGNTPFFEGDDQTTLDGELVVHGTGSEDFFNGGWYNLPGRWYGRVSLPLSGALDYNNPLARTGGYRLFLADAYPFRRSMLQTIEHAPTGNKIQTDYASVAFYYADERRNSHSSFPALAERRIQDLERIVFQPGWIVPVESFSMRGASLEKKTEKLNGKAIRYLSMRAVGEDRFGPHHLALRCGLPAAGRYRVSIKAMRGPTAATVQLYRSEMAIGAPAALTGATHEPGDWMTLGEFDFESGPNVLFFKLRNPGQPEATFSFDLIQIQFERTRNY